MAQVGYASEWALARFFRALREQQVQENFELLYLCGREENEQEAFARLKELIGKELKSLQGVWRGSQRVAKIESALDLMEYFHSGKAKYLPVNGDLTLPEEVHQGSDAVAIFSSNRTHLDYLYDALKHGKSVLCEKPLVALLDTRGRPDDSQLRELEEILRDADPKLIIMDSEHYSYKKASLLFYEHQDKILRGRKIKKVEGALKEIDNPAHARTQAILSIANGTGLLLDTGVHLQAFITYLGGKVEVTNSEFGIYPGYSVDTYDKINFRISGELFSPNAVGNLVVAKFIDKFLPPEEEESKYLKLFLEDDTEVEIDFKAGKVTEKTRPSCQQDGPVSRIDFSFFRYPLDQNEYVNILGHFYESIKLQQPPRTDARSSLKTLQALFQMYTQHRKEIYPYSTPPHLTPPAASMERSSATARGGE